MLALIRSLPKSLRTRFVPAPETAKRVVPMLRFGEGDIHAAVAAALSHLGGISVPPDAFQEDRLPAELRMNVRVTDAEGRPLAAGRDLEAIRRELGPQAAESFSQVDDPRWNRDGLTDWDFDELPAEIELPRGRLSVKAYPALVDRDDSVSLRLVDSPQRAEHETHFGLRRLCFLAAQRELKTQVDWLPNLDQDGALRGDARGLRPARAACRVAGRPRHGGRPARAAHQGRFRAAAGRRPRADRLGRAGADRGGEADLRGLPSGMPCRRGVLQRAAGRLRSVARATGSATCPQCRQRRQADRATGAASRHARAGNTPSTTSASRSRT